MAPLCADPRQVVIALEPPQRQALVKLVQDVVAHMLSELDTPADELDSVIPEVEADSKPASSPSRRQSLDPAKGAGEAESIQRAAVEHMERWRDEFLPRLLEIAAVQDSSEIRAERRAKCDQQPLDAPQEGGPGNVEADDVASLRALYRPVPTELVACPPEDRREALSCMLLLLLATGKYSAHSRVLLLHMASALELPQAFVDAEEGEIARSLIASSTADGGRGQTMSAEAEAAKRRQENKASRFWKVGLASVAGAAVIGVTGGLAAPLVAGAVGGILGGVGLGGVASFLGLFWMNGALVGALFGAYGAKMTGEMMDSYAREVEDFRFIPLRGHAGGSSSPPERDEEPPDRDRRRLRVTIGVNGWLRDEDDVTAPWRVLGPDTEVFVLRYEMKTLLALGTALRDLVQLAAWKTLKVELIKRTALATLWAALWPVQVLAAASNVDNPFGRAANRSRKAGRLLADALASRVQGERPVVLVGYSLGAAAVHACLQELAAAAVVVGTPAPADPAHWRPLRAVVSGPVFNVFSRNDLVLGFVYRLHSLALGVAGLQPVVGVDGIRNLDLSDRVSGHLRYPDLVGEILARCGFVGVAAAEIQRDDGIRAKDQLAEGGHGDASREPRDDAEAPGRLEPLGPEPSPLPSRHEPPPPAGDRVPSGQES